MYKIKAMKKFCKIFVLVDRQILVRKCMDEDNYCVCVTTIVPEIEGSDTLTFSIRVKTQEERDCVFDEMNAGKALIIINAALADFYVEI